MARNAYGQLQMKLVVLAFMYPIWILSAPVFGIIAIWKLVAWFKRQQLRHRQVTSCPRGHLVPLYGVYECACRAIHEGWVFGPCRVCQENCGWTPCLECGLPIGNPFL